MKNLLTRSLPVLIVAALTTVAQPQDKRPEFEVASVKPMGPDSPCLGLAAYSFVGCGPQVDDQRFTFASTVYDFIVNAYGLKVCAMKMGVGADCPLISGVPPWLSKDLFAIQAKMPDNSAGYTRNQFLQGDAPQLYLMLQALLADRFNLKVDRETKQLPVFALSVGKNGPKLKQAAEPELKQAPDGSLFKNRGMGAFMTPRPDGDPIVRITFTDESMPELAASLASYMDRPVLDRTGLNGKFDFKIEYEVDRSAPTAGDTGLIGSLGIAGPAMFTAIQQQLGLKLESTKGPVEVLVIDHVEKPSEN